MRLAAFFAAGLLCSCSTLPVPGPALSAGSDPAALSVLRESARRHGDPWQKRGRVEVAYDGEWSGIAVRLQPVLTDSGYRKSSIETYRPPLREVRQVHCGPSGTKEVLRRPGRIEVRYGNTASGDPEVLAAAALVADAYTVFLFGSSWLADNGRDLQLLGNRELDGESCRLVAGRLSPGFGGAATDHFIAWTGLESGLLKRIQFTLEGLDSTRGADVDVVFSEHWKAPDGSVWPGRFKEHIQRPLRAKAHEWRMTGLKFDGREIQMMRDEGMAR